MEFVDVSKEQLISEIKKGMVEQLRLVVPQAKIEKVEWNEDGIRVWFSDGSSK